MACYKVTVTVIDPKCGGDSGCSWKYTFYTRLNPNPGDPPTEGLSQEDQDAEKALRRAMSDPLDMVRDPEVKRNRKTRTFGKSCKINVKDYAKNGSWQVSFDPNQNTDSTDGYSNPSVPYNQGNDPPWGNIDVDYSVDSDPVQDGTCDQNFAGGANAQALADTGENYQQESTDCGCKGSGDSGISNFSGNNIGGLSQSFHAQTTTTIEDFIDYIEQLKSSCLSNNGQKFTLQFFCLPKRLFLEPFLLPNAWDTLSDAQKINFLNSKVTILQQTLGNTYYQQISLKTNCLKSAGTIINGHIYKQ